MIYWVDDLNGWGICMDVFKKFCYWRWCGYGYLCDVGVIYFNVEVWCLESFVEGMVFKIFFYVLFNILKFLMLIFSLIIFLVGSVVVKVYYDLIN